ncbi:LysR substrate-binding domain-containing protein [Pelobacter propionicus]|uniref:Transcriptional regulator, LysR family n=1 Tax=Pelobacter propionicus (strain DSM 2379 / NBRC 103807 / OttBd1) TaxID=338966 RepID=A1AR18_PELPD|nr:LysR substrate-binding domain-containing protein [Pelobacter propionicus]ABK99788.1 transcriptional regulator, LysR family [Pelobacter propionicus DSM 2379]
MAITLRQLEIFEKVASCAHVTQASQELLLTQSAASMAIAELERLAGAPLFERQGKRLLLNDRGRRILPEVRQVLVKVRTIERFLDESVAEPKGTLNLGASTTIGNYMLPAIVGEFSRLYPSARALLQVGNAQQIETGVERGELDLGLIEGIPHIPSLTATPWRRDELVVIAGTGHAWAEEKRATPGMLKNASWIMREKGSGTREIFEAAMEKKGVRFSIALELGHTEAIKKAAEAGLGVGCLSRMAVQRELDNGWLVEVATPLNLKRTLIILTRESERMTTLLKAFLALLQQSRDLG